MALADLNRSCTVVEEGASEDAAAAAPDAEEPAQERERRQGCSSNKSNECMVKMQLLLRLMRRSLHKRTIQVLARMN